MNDRVAAVEEALFKTATGSVVEYDEIDEIWITEEDENGELVLDSNGEPKLKLKSRTIKRKKKPLPPMTSAQQMYLKAHYPEKYAKLNKQELKDGLESIITAFTGEDVNSLFDEGGES